MTQLIIPGQKTSPTNAQQGVDPTQERLRIEGLRADLRAKKQAAVTALESAITLLKESERPAVLQSMVTTIKSHPQDFQLRELPRVEVHMALLIEGFMSDQHGRPASDLVLYWPLDRQIAFGIWNGRFVAQGQASTCITMRPQRFIETMAPDEAYDNPNVDDVFENVRQIVGFISKLAGIEPSR
jgi:hypothetical protein